MAILSSFVISFLGIILEKIIKSFTLKKRIGLLCFFSIILINIIGLATTSPTDSHNFNYIQFNNDHESYLLTIFYSMTLFTSLLIIPKFSMDLTHSWALFFNLFTALGIYFSDNLTTFLIFWILSLVPTFILLLEHPNKQGKVSGKMFLFYQSLSIILFIAALIIMGVDQILVTNFADLTHLPNLHHKEVPIILLILAVLIREGIFPFHSWAREKSKNLSLPFYTSFMLVQSGFMLFYKFVRPMMDFDISEAFPILSALSILSSIYLALLGIAETNLKNIFSAIFLSLTSIILTGFELGDKLGVYGGLFEWMSLTLTLGSWASVIYLINLRLDSSVLKFHQGLLTSYPRLATLFFVLGFLSIGFPLGMGFVGDDLLVHGIIEHYPWLGIGIIITACLNSINIYRAFILIFTGEPPKEKLSLDISLKHYLPFVFILLVIFTIGIFPSVILKKSEFNQHFFTDHSLNSHETEAQH